MDVEKFLTELENLNRKLKYTEEKHKKDNVHTFDTNISLMCHEVNNKISEAIQTIRELQSKSEEVCEWRIVDRPNGFPIFNTSCGAIRLTCAKGIDIYCNVCGRKIKVVE